MRGKSLLKRLENDDTEKREGLPNIREMAKIFWCDVLRMRQGRDETGSRRRSRAVVCKLGFMIPLGDHRGFMGTLS